MNFDDINIIDILRIAIDIIGIILTFIGIIIAVYKFNESIRATLRAESSWREELFNVSSTFKVDRNHLLCLRAHQKFSYAYINLNKFSNKDIDIAHKGNGDIVRDRIGIETFNLYKKYILESGKYTKIASRDQKKIRDLAIALLKYDFIKRGDNDNLIYFLGKRKRELKREEDYKELLDWIDLVI